MQLLVRQGDAQQAGELFSALLGEEPENGDAWGGLIRSLMAMGQEEAAEEALEQVPEKLVPEDMEATKGIAQHLLVDSRKAVTQLGWRPTDPAETIPVSVRWHLAHPPADPDQDFSPDDRALAAADT